ncbi:bifunctional DNA primase/polymerase [Prescottella equi]|uniref:bifunctional DNA primase/polymerase n=1 Tax=Rhodococcus hoagii TaxID=43767 RepID=UPI000A10C5CA|nr:bifunctional DNA primase/polymerase [Prescottella equi]
MQPNSTTAQAARQSRKHQQGNAFRRSIVPAPDGTARIRFKLGLRVPEGVNNMLPMDAALAYAEAGWFVLPVMPGTKNPGSVVGNGWPSQSTHDPNQIREWWSENPDYGIALHSGRSGAVVFDLDTDELAALPRNLREALQHGKFQSTRCGTGDREHYAFAVPPGESYGNSAGAFAAFDDVRGKNGVIVTAPTPHVDAETHGGGYLWGDSGVVPDLPDALRACLRSAPEREAEPMTEADLGDFFAKYTENDRPGALSGVLKVFEQNVNGGMSRHEALVLALPMAYREAVAGCYPAETATAEIQEAFNTSFHLSITGGGRSRPAPDEFARTARWAAAQALLADPGETLARLNRDEVGLSEREAAFWAARPELSTVRLFAQARMVAPWALFGSVLARALMIVPPRVVLPALVGSHGSVNSFVALVGPSGAGKSVTRGAARDVLTLKFDGDTQLHVRNVGSGEGLVDQFATYDAKAKAYVGLRTRVMFTVDEVETLTAQGSRSGSTLMPTLRTAWTGDSLGFANRDKTKAIPVEAHRYRLTMVVGVQPTKAQPLLDDADGGTPQRFLWMPTADPDAPEVEPAEPDPITVGPWPQPQPQNGFKVNRPDTSEVALVTVPATGREFIELAIPDYVRAEVRSQRRRVLRGDADVNPLDGHALMARLKVAVALMVLNGRYDTVIDEDWNLAGVVMEVSNRTRREVEKAIAAEARTVNQGRGKAEAQREIAKAEVLQKDGLARVCKRIVKRLNEIGAMERSAVRSFLDRDKNLMDEAVELLAARGEVELDRYAAKNGSATWRITAKA